MLTRARVHVRGVVQGVGFRPFVYRLAQDMGLKGYIRNTVTGVTIEVEGQEDSVKQFPVRLRNEKPPLAAVEEIQLEMMKPSGYRSFEIFASKEERGPVSLVPPDVATCDQCLAETLDSMDRRYRYPFTNCTNCGPRFTIIEGMPYDRPKTSMKSFEMCDDCRREYTDVGDRRYHAQPVACPRCGPQVFLECNGTRVSGDEAVKLAAKMIEEGKTVAVKGLGGFHLACNAQAFDAVERLRRRKSREEKPLAIMSLSLDEVLAYCDVSPKEEMVLLSRERPIVLLRKKSPCSIADNVAPSNRYLGVMLPYTPLHRLLLGEVKDILAIVLTSGNISDEPLAAENDEGRKRLSDIADAFLMHDRGIVNRCDDSVVRLLEGEMSFVRRARGFAPLPVTVPLGAEAPIMACGPELKNTMAFLVGRNAFISQHIGDMKNAETMDHFEITANRLKDLLRVDAEVYAHDLHPLYLSTEFALSQEGRKIGVQHHHAHIASVMAEHQINAPVLGLSCDGMGFGTDGQAWGCEILRCTYEDFERIGKLQYVPMPGGDLASLEPRRMALSYLVKTLGPDHEETVRFMDTHFPGIGSIVLTQIERGINSPMTSSLGRLFDAVSSLSGFVHENRYEGQAAMRLENEAAEGVADTYPYEIRDEDILTMCPDAMIEGVVGDLGRELAPQVIASKFHNTVAVMLAEACEAAARKVHLEAVALSGGVFQNALLTSKLLHLLRSRHMKTLVNRKVPANDGGISLGQAAVAAARLR